MKNTHADVPFLHSILRGWHRWANAHRKSVVAGFLIAAHLMGAVTSVRAIMETRTAQGAVAWAVSLNTFPYVAVPAYWIFGQKNFVGYVKLRRSESHELDPFIRRVGKEFVEGGFLVTPNPADRSVVEKLAKLSMSRYNSATLLIDGEATFGAIFQAIEAADDYLLIQFYIVRDDQLGRRLKALLLKKAQQGVRVHFLYDEIGSYKLPRSFIADLRAGGVDIRPFNTRQGRSNRFQLNFRNHRKIVVADGKVAFVGGLNVGDEYLGRDEAIGRWRDTHVKVAGPIVQAIQLAFVEDWKWAAESMPPALNWKPRAAAQGNLKVLCLPTGPADEFESCALFFLHSINSAKERIWISSPYFVPDEQIMSALILASLRGVDVRILLPEKSDNQLVYLSSFSYLAAAEKAGIGIYRYTHGFLHQKAMLVDDHISAIGTANFDNRSFRLNFEITLLFDDPEFASQVEAVFKQDFAHSRKALARELSDHSFAFRFAVKCARLLAPIQ